MIEVSTSELRVNMSDLLGRAMNEDIIVMKNGRQIAKITRPDVQDERSLRLEAARSLFGILPIDAERDIAKTEYLEGKK